MRRFLLFAAILAFATSAMTRAGAAPAPDRSEAGPSPGCVRAAGAVAGPELVAAPSGQWGWGLDLDRAMDAVGLGPGMIVGEAGAGDGYFTLPMARRVGPSGKVLANDISRRALASLARRSAREQLDNIETVVGEVDDPRFSRRDLQLIVLVHAFHDFARPVEWLVNAKRYLRPGGRLAVIDRDPAQGGGSHFWPQARIVGYADEAGYDLVTAVTDISRHLIVVFVPRDAGRQASPRSACG